MTLEQIEELRMLESLLPIAADSVVVRYRRYEPEIFYATYSDLIRSTVVIIDSLNRPLPAALRIDTLAIDHTFESLGEAARRSHTLYLSSSYYYLYESLPFIRSVVWHEFGHVYYALLSEDQRARMRNIWGKSRVAALFYVFRDGEYSQNARFGGHPDDSPEELFASAFNLFRNRPEEIVARAEFVSPSERDLINQLRDLVREASPGL